MLSTPVKRLIGIATFLGTSIETPIGVAALLCAATEILIGPVALLCAATEVLIGLVALLAATEVLIDLATLFGRRLSWALGAPRGHAAFRVALARLPFTSLRTALRMLF